jgi:enoyl-CoA hydratase
VLDGRFLSAQEALQFGLVNRVVAADQCLPEAVALAARIAARAPVALRLGKEAINAAFETALSDGLALERRLFVTLFATDDQKEGMSAFIEKRAPVWRGR